MNPDAIRRILWGAFVASVVVHAAVPLLVPLTPPAQAPPLGPVFAAMALACAAGAIAVRSLGLVRPIARGALDPSSAAGAQRVTAMMLGSWALAEMPSLLGLVLAFLTGVPRAGWPLAGLSLLALLALFPRVPAPPASSSALARSGVKIG